MNFTSSSTHSQKPSYEDDHCEYGGMSLFWNKCPLCWRHRPPLSLVTVGGLTTSRTIRRYTAEINPMLLCQWVRNLLLSNGCTLTKPFQELLQQALLDRVTNACFLYMYAHYPLLHYALPYYIRCAFQQSQKKGRRSPMRNNISKG